MSIASEVAAAKAYADELEQKVFDLEVKLENSWAGKHVFLVAVISAVIGYIV